MGTKTISVMDDAYELLARNKLEGESFSDEIRRILKKKKSILDFAGAWKMSKKESKELDEFMQKSKKMWSDPYDWS